MTRTQIPIPRIIRDRFKRWADGSKTALRNYEAGYRRAVRQRVARGEGTVAEINEMNRAFVEAEERERGRL